MEKLILPDISGIPRLYGTKNIATDDKIVHQVWRLPIIPGVPIFVVDFFG